MSKRIHIFGGSGSGTTTLGAHLALALDAPHADADDYFWLPTDPPYRDKRPIEDRLRLMNEVFATRDRWVLSGSTMRWGGSIIAMADLVVQVTLDPKVRMTRLMARERAAYGDRIAEGGDMRGPHLEFFAWAQSYDDPTFSGRNRAAHDRWAASLSCPVVKVDSAAPIDALVKQALAFLENPRT